jgi:DNA polymerase-3 subunit delta'
MNNTFHVTVFEGESSLLIEECKKFCIDVLGKNFEHKIKKSACSDVIFIDPKDKKSIGISEVRGIQADSLLKPVECDYKIYVIKNSDALTVQAQNALLKIFEDPPNHVLFVLLCGNYKKLLPTIISRARIIRLGCSGEIQKSEDCSNFIYNLIRGNNFHILSECGRYDKKREKLRNFIENCRTEMLKMIKSGSLGIENIKFCDKLTNCLNLLDINVNQNLAIASIVVS